MTQLQQKFIFYSSSDQTWHWIQSLLNKTDSSKNRGFDLKCHGGALAAAWTKIEGDIVLSNHYPQVTAEQMEWRWNLYPADGGGKDGEEEEWQKLRWNKS